VIRAATRRSLDRGHEVIGVREGWRGLVDGRFQELGRREISGILPRGGTIIGTTRTNPFNVEGGVEKVLHNFGRQGLDALVAIGGGGTPGGAPRPRPGGGPPRPRGAQTTPKAPPPPPS